MGKTGTMRKVVDCCGLESPRLEEYLASSRTNFVLLPDVLQYEAFAAGELVQQKFAILARHPGQSLLLLPSWRIWRIWPREKNVASRFIDREQSARLPKYLHYLVGGQPGLVANAKRKRDEALDFLEKLKVDAGPIRDEMNRLLASYSPGDLAALRSGRRLRREFCQRLSQDVANDAAKWLRDVHGNRPFPSADGLKASFLFRVIVSHCALGVRRAATGGLRNLTVERFRNDLNDCMYVAYATLFDGLITADGGMVETYNIAVTLLEGVFGCTRLSAEVIRTN